MHLLYTVISMRCILVSDLHANLPALEAFFVYLETHWLAELPVYFLGDYVNLGAFPEETVALLRSFEGSAYLAGNHDRYIINERALDHNPYFGSPQGVIHCRWTRDQLSLESRRWLAGLPVRHQFDSDGYHIDMIHGRHNSDEETLDADILETTKPIIYLCGHTHVPRIQKTGKARIYNPGSLGKPLDKDPRGSFGILETGPDGEQFEVVRFEYDIDRAVKGLEDRLVPWRTGIINSLKTAEYRDEE